MRRYRRQRLTGHVVARDYGAVLLFDLLNIRYATDSTNMQLWNAHSPFRALLVCADGFEIMEGEELTEKARSIKGPDEIKAMRCESHSCETPVWAMEDFARAHAPSGEVSEDDNWAVLHAENIRRRGE